MASVGVEGVAVKQAELVEKLEVPETAKNAVETKVDMEEQCDTSWEGTASLATGRIEKMLW